MRKNAWIQYSPTNAQEKEWTYGLTIKLLTLHIYRPNYIVRPEEHYITESANGCPKKNDNEFKDKKCSSSKYFIIMRILILFQISSSIRIYIHICIIIISNYLKNELYVRKPDACPEKLYIPAIKIKYIFLKKPCRLFGSPGY